MFLMKSTYIKIKRKVYVLITFKFIYMYSSYVVFRIASHFIFGLGILSSILVV